MTTATIDFSKVSSISTLPKFDTSVFELNLSTDLWASDDEPKVDERLMQLQAKHFTKWLRKQVREYGRRFEVGTENDCPVEVWLAEIGYKVNFIAGGEVEMADGTLLTTNWTSASYYMFREDGHMEVKAGRWLDIMTQCENSESYLISR